VSAGGASERQRLIDALAAASVVSNSASPRVSGKLKCLDVASFHEFLDDYQELTCPRDVVNRLIQVSLTIETVVEITVKHCVCDNSLKQIIIDAVLGIMVSDSPESLVFSAVYMCMRGYHLTL